MDDTLAKLHQKPLDPAFEVEITHKLWPLCARHDVPLPDSYFQYFIEQCRLAFHDAGRHIVDLTSSDVAAIVEDLRSSMKREDIRDTLRPRFPTHVPGSDHEARLGNAIDFAARVFLMINIGELEYGFSSLELLDWTSGSIKKKLAEYFGELRTNTSEHAKLEKIFNGRNLERIAGFKIKWTSNLAEHLLVDGERKDHSDSYVKTVRIFHHASFLKRNQQNAVFPAGLVDETLRSIALLFPQSDGSIRDWIRKQKSVDQMILECGYLKANDRKIEKFDYWRDRLISLKQEFDEAEPTTLSQWWFDRRKGAQWYAFWVGLVVLFFTVVGVLEGALQVFKAYHPTSG